MTLEKIWRHKSNKELEIAARQLINYTEEAEQVIRAEMRRRGIPEPPPTLPRPELPTSKRDLLLELFLVFFGLGNIYLVFYCLYTFNDLVSHSDPRFPHWPFLVIAIVAALTVVSVIGLWLWKKWGLSLFIICQVVALLVAIPLINKIGFLTSLPNLVIGLIGPIIMIVLVNKHWRYFN